MNFSWCIVLLFSSKCIMSLDLNDDDETGLGEVLKSERSGRLLSGSHCEYLSLCEVSAVSGCDSGSKFVVKANNTVRKFMRLDNETVIVFITKGQNVTECQEFTEITSKVECKTVSGADSIDLGRSDEVVDLFEIPIVSIPDLKPSYREGKGSFLTGSACEYVSLCSSALTCEDGSKMRLKAANETRRQLLVLNNHTVMAFVGQGQKFTECTNFTEITSNVKCKAVDGASSIDLPGNRAGKFKSFFDLFVEEDEIVVEEESEDMKIMADEENEKTSDVMEDDLYEAVKHLKDDSNYS